MIKRPVVDASALLALIHEEAGSQFVADHMEKGAILGAVNFSEVISKLSEAGVPGRIIQEITGSLGLEVLAFDRDLAYIAGSLRLKTKNAGLSFGDRACLALAQKLELPCLTADKAWADLALPVEIQLIR